MAKRKIIISFNGDEGAGKSTVAKMVAEKMSIPRFYMGQIFRDAAKKKGLPLVVFLEGLEKNPEWEKEIDDHVINLPEKEDSFVIESRTAWHFIPQSIKIYLEVDAREGARRIFEHLKSKNQRNEGADLDSIEKTMASLERRRKDDDKRYMSLYGIDIRNKDNYDLIINTTGIGIEKVYDEIIRFIDEKSA